MAVNKTVVKRSLVLVFNDGTDAKGNAKTKNISFGDVKVDAQPEQIMTTASAFSPLYNAQWVDVYVTESAALTTGA